MAYKTASRRMQYISVKVAAGISVPHRGGPAPKLSPVESAKLKQRRHLALVRQVFELEQEIDKAMSMGLNVARLKQQQQDLRSGKTQVDLRYANDGFSKAGKISQATSRQSLSEKNRSNRKPYQYVDKGRRGKDSRLNASTKSLEIDLQDIAKQKLTPSGILIIKTLLHRLDVETVAHALNVEKEFIEKTQTNAFYALVEVLDPKEMLMIVDVLMNKIKPN